MVRDKILMAQLLRPQNQRADEHVEHQPVPEQHNTRACARERACTRRPGRQPLACRKRVAPASSHAAPASRVRRSRRLRFTLAAAPVLLAHANVTEIINIFSMGPKLRYPMVMLQGNANGKHAPNDKHISARSSASNRFGMPITSPNMSACSLLYFCTCTNSVKPCSLSGRNHSFSVKTSFSIEANTYSSKSMNERPRRRCSSCQHKKQIHEIALGLIILPICSKAECVHALSRIITPSTRARCFTDHLVVLLELTILPIFDFCDNNVREKELALPARVERRLSEPDRAISLE